MTHAAIEVIRSRLVSALDQRHRPRLRRSADRGKARRLPGEAQRQRREHRLDDGRGVLGQLAIGGAGQHQNAGVADRDHIGGARDIGEEADFTHQFAGAKLGDRRGIVRFADRERAMQHHEQGIRGIALRHQHLPAHQILTHHRSKSLSPLFGTERSEQREVLGRVSPANVEFSPSIGAPGSDWPLMYRRPGYGERFRICRPAGRGCGTIGVGPAGIEPHRSPFWGRNQRQQASHAPHRAVAHACQSAKEPHAAEAQRCLPKLHHMLGWCRIVRTTDLPIYQGPFAQGPFTAVFSRPASGHDGASCAGVTVTAIQISPSKTASGRAGLRRQGQLISFSLTLS